MRSWGRGSTSASRVRELTIEKRYERITWRILPVLLHCYLVAYLDRDGQSQRLCPACCREDFAYLIDVHASRSSKVFLQNFLKFYVKEPLKNSRLPYFCDAFGPFSSKSDADFDASADSFGTALRNACIPCLLAISFKV